MLRSEIAGILIFVLVIIFIRLALIFRACSPRSTALKTNPVPSTSPSQVLSKVLENIQQPVRFSSQQLRIATNNFSHKLGEGSFGTVYQGQFACGLSVAVKVLKGSSEKKIEEQFLAEVSTIGRTHHINLVQLYGFCFDRDIRALVYEYMQNGSLDRLLFRQDKNIEWEVLFNIAVGTAKGIAYLHEDCQHRIIHYDIKPENILLDENFCPKVADFGLAELSSREKTHWTPNGGLRGTPGYAAPEMWAPFRITQKCDVYSFGMLLFEILGKRRNLDLNLPDSQEWFPRWLWKKFERGEFSHVMRVGRIHEKDLEEAQLVAQAALWCVQYRPELRPSMGFVVKMLEGGVEIPSPKNPFRHLMETPLPDLLAEVTGEACSFPPAVAETKAGSHPSFLPISNTI
ncbi:hypothetical protein CRG98_033221 [Punica granatum]|uniref:Protein kinase domain-containing protein n=1 Tax=Punica granatum TaxID=22663 RepID=A0A2I0IRM7_PUNGR|nr:hypothetical protein CRG98_033221 [Punica granatum]